MEAVVAVALGTGSLAGCIAGWVTGKIAAWNVSSEMITLERKARERHVKEVKADLSDETACRHSVCKKLQDDVDSIRKGKSAERKPTNPVGSKAGSKPKRKKKSAQKRKKSPSSRPYSSDPSRSVMAGSAAGYSASSGGGCSPSSGGGDGGAGGDCGM